MKARGQIPPMKPSEAKRFTVGTTCDGWEVIDNDGRPVSEVYFDQGIAYAASKKLNQAAVEGHKALAVALGCIEEEDLEIEAAGEVSA